MSGADVWLVDAITADEGRRFGMELIWSIRTRPNDGATPVVVHGRTDATGRFALELSPEVVARRRSTRAGCLDRNQRARATCCIPAAAANHSGRRPAPSHGTGSADAHSGHRDRSCPTTSRACQDHRKPGERHSGPRTRWALRSRQRPMPTDALSSRAWCPMRSVCKHQALELRR